MSKNYQTKRRRAATLKSEVAVPETVSVAMGELAANLKEGVEPRSVTRGTQGRGSTPICGCGWSEGPLSVLWDRLVELNR